MGVQKICGKQKKIISKTYYKIFVERKYPDFLFLVLEFLEENEGNIINNLEVEERSFKNRIIYNREIIEFLKENLILFNEEYKLAGFINTPKSDHYTALIINLNNDNIKLKKGLNYYYDDFSPEYNIEEVSEKYKSLLMKVNPYIAVYLKFK